MTSHDQPKQKRKSDLDTSDSLISRARRLDEGAWVRLVNLYTPLIDYWIRQRGIKGHDIENIRQEVFHRLTKSIGNFSKSQSGRGSFRGYLRTITQNLIASIYRKNEAAARGGTGALLQFNQIAADNESFSSLFDSISQEWGGFHRSNFSVEDGILFRRIMNWVQGNCSRQQAQVFTEIVIENKLPRDVAKELGMSVGNVYQTKARILNHIRKEFVDLV